MDISNFQSIIEEYEKLVRELTEDLELVRSEQESLKSTITELLNENQKLTAEKNQNLQTLQQNSEQCQILLTADEKELIIENLKEQLESTLLEKEYTVKLWKNAVTTIDKLEDELRIFQAGTQGFVPKKDVMKLKSSYENKIQSLEQHLLSTQKQLNELSKQTSTKIEAKNVEVDKSLQTQAGALNIIKNLEEEILNLQKRLQECTEYRVRMEKHIKKMEVTVEEMKQKNVEYRTKVTEAVTVVEAALNEKDAALFREKELEEEIQKLSQTLSDVVKQAEEKFKRDISNITNDYQNKEKKLLQDLNDANYQIKEKAMEIEKYVQKYVFLENEIQRMQRGNINIDESSTSKLLVLEKNLEATFQKLLLSEKQNIQLVSERDCIKNDLEQMANLYERNLKTKEIENATLKNKLQNLQTEIKEGNRQMEKLLKNVETLRQKLTVKEQEYYREKESYERLVHASTSEKIIEITKKYNENLSELQNQVKLKNEINIKLINETKSIADNLEKVIKESRNEIHKLKHENYVLKEKLQKANEKMKQYKLFLDVISQDVNKITTMTVS